MEEINILQEPKPKTKTDETETLSFGMGSIVLIIGMVAVAVVFGLQLYQQNQTQPEPGHPAPEIELVSFNGTPFNLEDYRGQVIVVNFWASWCAPCRDEAEDLQLIHEDYQDKGVVMVGVNWLDAEQDALRFMAEFGMTYLNGADLGEVIARDYNITGVPETFVIDQNGRVAAAYMLPVYYEQLAEDIDRLLEG